jgi:predicted acylesterase/phospholipase RssA/CRP-like cAMP-binding protein
MNEAIIALLKLHEYFREVPDDVLSEITQCSEVSYYPSGAVVHEANTVFDRLSFVLRGKLKAVRIDSRGIESLFRMIGRGEQIGMLFGALSEPIPVRVIALEPSTVLSLPYEQALELTLRNPQLRRHWLTTFAGSLHKHFFGSVTRRSPMVLALVHDSETTRHLAERVVSRLGQLGERLAIFSDSQAWRELRGVRFRFLEANGKALEPEEIRKQTFEWQDATRIIFDVRANLEPERATRLLGFAERVIYFIVAAEGDAGFGRLKNLVGTDHGWRDKVSIAWLLSGSCPIAPDVPNLMDFACRDFKITESSPEYPWGKSVANGLERLVHDLRGVRIGVALGGGAARGMSHLGVLKALEQNGIVIDVLSGTSAGAMTGIAYASGFDPDYSARQFAADLRPSWFFRQLPRGNHWHLMYKYRSGQFDPMLRKYLQHWRLEQLPVQIKSVAVDLVSCQSLIRERGDAVQAILESINLPVLSLPICRDGQALIDGGFVNNIPADVLVSMGCNFVIAVSVTARIEQQFSGILPNRPCRSGIKPGIVSTLLRTYMVQNHCLNAIGVQPADMVIEPDVTGFDLTEFARTEELAAAGTAAAAKEVPKIRQLLNRLDPDLFSLEANKGDRSNLN